jgi:hypothetical protein
MSSFPARVSITLLIVVPTLDGGSAAWLPT